MTERRIATDAHTDAPGDQRRLSAAEAGREGLRQIVELTGKDPETVTGVERSTSGWVVTVEVVEDHRVPSSTDVLATYETEIDGDGELQSYRRTRRYPRGRGDEGIT
jgi:hypothetical protein